MIEVFENIAKKEQKVGKGRADTLRTSHPKAYGITAGQKVASPSLFLLPCHPSGLIPFPFGFSACPPCLNGFLFFLFFCFGNNFKREKFITVNTQSDCELPRLPSCRTGSFQPCCLECLSSNILDCRKGYVLLIFKGIKVLLSFYCKILLWILLLILAYSSK